MIAESHLGGRKLASMPTTAMLGMRTTVQRLQSKPAFAESRRYRLAFDAFICASWSDEAETLWLTGHSRQVRRERLERPTTDRHTHGDLAFANLPGTA